MVINLDAEGIAAKADRSHPFVRGRGLITAGAARRVSSVFKRGALSMNICIEASIDARLNPSD
jgi:hypothetical protein